MNLLKFKTFSGAILFICIIMQGSCFAQTGNGKKTTVKIISDEADCVINILNKKQNDETILEKDWKLLFKSEGYIRLKKREEAMKRGFTDSEFKSFVLSDTLYKWRGKLSETLTKWKHADVNESANLAFAYLPAGSSIKAKIFIEIKPKKNSFVFDMETDPAIFIYLNPEVSREKFVNTLAHELHHIGFAQNCEKAYEKEISSFPLNIKSALEWIGAFGEGFAMIAAAGGPDIHPHAVSGKEETERWDNDMANFNADLKKVEAFLTDVCSRKLKGEEITSKGMEFFGIQGPWYTVGYKMSAVIEKTFGRKMLIKCITDPGILLSVYNGAATEYNKKNNESLALWSDSLLKCLAK